MGSPRRPAGGAVGRGRPNPSDEPARPPSPRDRPPRDVRWIPLTSFRFERSLQTEESPMNAPAKPETPKKDLPARPTGEKPDAEAMADYVLKRFPKTMARLAE